MTLAHSVSSKYAEQSPQERKSCQASILTMKERVPAFEGGKPDTAVARFAAASVGLWGSGHESSHGSSLQTGKSEALSTVGGWQEFPPSSLRKGAKLGRPSRTDLGTKAFPFHSTSSAFKVKSLLSHDLGTETRQQSGWSILFRWLVCHFPTRRGYGQCVTEGKA